MHCIIGSLLSLGVIGLANAIPKPEPSLSERAVGAIKTIYQFPASPYVDIENVGARTNGNLVFGLITSPKVYTINPTAASPTPSLVTTFPTGGSVLGIAQPSTDLFTFAVGTYNTTTFAGVPGSFAIYSVDFSKTPPASKLVTKIPEAHALNGATTLTGSTTTILVADSALGAIFSVNVQTGAYKQIQQNSAYAPAGSIPLGINGIHTSGQTLYFTNSATGVYGSVPIASDGSAAGTIKTIAKSGTGLTYDDFALDSRQDAFIATHQTSLEEVMVSGTQTAIVNANPQLNNPSSAVFPANGQNGCLLYVVTGGTPTSSPVVSGGVYAVTIC